MAKIKYQNWCNRCIHFGSEFAEALCKNCDYLPNLMDGPYRYEPLPMVYQDHTATKNAASTEPTINDSGERTVFPNGFQRDMHTGKGRMDLLPWNAIIAVSQHCENGALKYGEHNIDRGCPMHSLMDSGMRHAAKVLIGLEDEPHLEAACWNLLWALEMKLTRKDMVDIPWKPEQDGDKNG